MPKSRPQKAPFPAKKDLLEFIGKAEGGAGKREIVRAFKIGAAGRGRLKAILAELEDDGSITRGSGGRYHPGGKLPPVTVLEITTVDEDGALLARPLSWPSDAAPPLIRMAADKRGGRALGPGNRVLARLTPTDDGYLARTIRRIDSGDARTVLGILAGDGGLVPVERGRRADIKIAPEDRGAAEAGDLVLAEIQPGRRLGPRRARVIERLGRTDGPQAASLIAIHRNDIPTRFGVDALDQAAAAKAAPLAGRADLRDVALVTIDDETARDFDDAVWAEEDRGADNPGGWHVIVAIADVAWYVRPDDALDREAMRRGNSVYFPDRVVPMLPAALSNGWCSLKEGEDRPCVAVHMRFDGAGNKIDHRFERAQMRSAARLTYGEVQAAADGAPGAQTKPLMATVIGPLFGAYRALMAARARRQPLDLDMPERRIILGPDGRVTAITFRPRFESHRLIEEFMIAANVAAAETLAKFRLPVMYRVHGEPPGERLEALRAFLASLDLRLAKGQVLLPRHFNRILEMAAGTEHARAVNEIVLRSQARAVYGPENIGHFGLALRNYAHFTSPIRRYADLLIHRALLHGLAAGGGATEGADDGRDLDFDEIGDHISMTERRAVAAERDAADRYATAFIADRRGEVFAGHITGVARFGLFVALADTGADGLVPVRMLPGDRYIFDERELTLRGQRTGHRFRLGEAVEVRLVEADALTGELILEVMTGAGPRNSGAKPRRRAKKGGKSRKRSKSKDAKKKRKT